MAATANSGERALEAFRQYKPDVTIVDLRLPDTSGFDLIRSLCGLSPGARIIVLSSYDGDSDIQRALQAGAQGYVAKGLVRDELLDAIRTVSAGGRYIPALMAQRLVSHIQEDALSLMNERCRFCHWWQRESATKRLPRNYRLRKTH